MKILHLYSGNLMGGIETQLITFFRLNHLAPGVGRWYGLCFPGALRDRLKEEGAQVYDLGEVRFSRPWTVLRARARLRRLLREERFDAVLIHACWSHALFAPVVRKAGIRFGMQVHDLMTGRSVFERLARRTPPDVVLANSRFTISAANEMFPGVPAEVVYFPMYLHALKDQALARTEIRSQLGVADDRVVILQASRLERWKGAALHIAALGRLKEISGWEAWFAGGAQKEGEAEYLAELIHLAEQFGVADRVRFLGQRADVPRLMAAADIYCQPNTGPEPFGISFVEALAARLPVVTADHGGGAEIVTAECGVLAPPGDVDAVAQALAKLIRDPDHRRALGAAGPARATELCDPARQLNKQAAALRGQDVCVGTRGA